METKTQTSATYLQSLLLIHVAMLLGIVIFVGVAVYSRVTGDIASTPLASALPMLYVVLGVSLVCLPLSFIIPGRLTVKAAEKPTFAGQLRAFQIACIVRVALLEAPSIIATAALFITGVYGFLVVPAIAVAAMAITVPSKTRVADSLQLGADDVRRLNDPAFALGEYVPADVS